MYQFSDSDSVDSDEGIRYKTESIRNKKSDDKSTKNERGRDSYNHRQRERSRSRSRSHRHTEKKKLKKRKKDYSPEDKSSRKSSSRSRHRESDVPDNRKHRKEKEKSTKEDGTTQRKRSEEPITPTLPTNEKITDQKQELDAEHEKDKSKNSSPTSNSTENVPFGPTLPPKSNTENTTDHLQNGNAFGPQLPPHLTKKPDKEDIVIGPVLPPHFITVSSLEDDSSDDLDASKSEKSDYNNAIGPTLPPHLSKKDEDDVIGPVVPAHLQQSNPQSTNDEDDDVYGPVPAGAQPTQAHLELEERALRMKMDQLDSSGNKQPVREEWMLTLPEAKAAKFGLGPRQFRSKPAPDLSDRSSWTDTPEDKAKKKEGKAEPKVDLRKEAELKQIQSRNLEQEKMAKKHRKEKDSLLEIHRKKLKEKKNESGPSERRPFSREIDLQVNRFDEAQKKAVLKKAQLLDTRFSSGEAKYL